MSCQNLSYLLFSVQHGSFMGPLECCTYTRSLGAIMRPHGLEYHNDADDTEPVISTNKKHSFSKLSSTSVYQI